jgi:hypothetical protein
MNECDEGGCHSYLIALLQTTTVQSILVTVDRSFASMMPRSGDSNVAVFIDYENVGGQPHFRARELLDHLKEHGRLIMKRAYADWSLYVSLI